MFYATLVVPVHAIVQPLNKLMAGSSAVGKFVGNADWLAKRGGSNRQHEKYSQWLQCTFFMADTQTTAQTRVAHRQAVPHTLDTWS